jgi:DNA-binding response OmpR family regulator
MLVELARDGHAAIALAGVVVPDVIVLDLGLRSDDGLNGLEVARRLRASAPTSSVPILIVSGSTSARDMAELQASGYDGHLVKPCSADELVEVVTALALGRRVDRAPSSRAASA